jgi:competence protein ComFC
MIPLTRAVEAAVDLLYPRNCLICERATLPEGEKGVVCGTCRSEVKFIGPPCCERCALPFPGAIETHFTCGYCKDLKFQFTRTVAICRAEGVVRECIHRFKYNREMYFGHHLAQWLVEGARQRVDDWSLIDLIVPVPLYPRKQREREFNQAEYLAEVVGRAMNKPVAASGIRRVKDTGTQTRLGAHERAENLRDAFAPRHSGVVEGKKVLLVDDVFTTGATLNGCAKVLRRAGAAEVWVLVLARGV